MRKHAHRLWHFVPDINGSTAGLENYRVFNAGRRRAFDEFFGPQAESLMPADRAQYARHLAEPTFPTLTFELTLTLPQNRSLTYGTTSTTPG